MNRRNFLERFGLSTAGLGLAMKGGLAGLLGGCNEDKKKTPDATGGKTPPTIPEADAYEAKSTGRHVTFASGLKLEIVDDRKLIGRGKEFYDPNHTGNPLLRVSEDDLEELVSKNFKLKEFAVMKDPELMSKHRARGEQTWKRGELDMGHAGERYWRFIRLDTELVDLLQEAREESGPMEINSGFRSFLYNKASYRKMGIKIVSNSAHVDGRAVDVSAGCGEKKKRRALNAWF